MKVKTEVSIKLQFARPELVTIIDALNMAGGPRADALHDRLCSVLTNPLEYVTEDGRWVGVINYSPAFGKEA